MWLRPAFIILFSFVAVKSGAQNIDQLISTAGELKYMREIKKLLAEQMESPSDEFVKFCASKVYDGLMQERWDYLVTVCDDANERCPFVPGSVKRLHWSFEDPSRARGTEEERLRVFRRVRDQIEQRLAEWLQNR